MTSNGNGQDNPFQLKFCEECSAVVEFDHRKTEHDGDPFVDIYPIVDREDGDYIAQPEDMGHISPHVWQDVDGWEKCPDCFAVKIPAEVLWE